MEEVIKKNDLFSNRDLRKLLIPLIIEQLLAMAVGLADSIMVASVGESAVSAVSLVDTVIILILNIFAALATGGAVVVGQYLGQKNNEKACKSGEQLLVIVSFISLLVMALMFMGKGFILNVVFGTIEPDVAHYANTYMNIVFFSIPFIALYNCGAALFRAMSNTKMTMITSIIMNLINVFGNALFIYGFHMKIEGVAIPTLVSRAVAAVVILALLTNKKLIVNIKIPFRFNYDRYLVKNILYIGIPSGIENSIFQLGKILLLSIIALYGTASITANAVANTISAFQVLPAASVGLALLTVVSRCVGAGDYEQARFYTRKLFKFAYIALFIINTTIYLNLRFIIDIYQLSDETAMMVRQVILFHSLFASLIWPLSFTLPNVLRASNDVRYTMFVGVGSMWIVRIGFGVVLAKYLNMGMFGVWLAMFIDWGVRSLFYVLRYRGTRWQIKRL